jgi:spore germination protein YaaH
VGALVSAITAHPPLVESIGVACQSVQKDGTMLTLGQGAKGRDRAAIVSALRARGIGETSLVIANTGGAGFDGKLGAALLASDVARKRLVSELRDVVQKETFATFELDFEALPTSAAKDYVRFVSEIAATKGARVVVDVHPKTVDDPGWDGPGGHDYPALAKTGAVLRLMTYDLSIGPVPPGPSTKASWIREVVAYAKGKGVPPAQLEVGLPAYGYDFPPKGKGEPMPLRHAEVLALIAKTKSTVARDENGTPHFAYQGTGGAHEVWFDDAQSLERVLDALRPIVDDVRGIAIWGIGGADQALFAMLEAQGFSR